MRDPATLSQYIDKPLFHMIGSAADELGVDAYLVGGYVRDLLLGRPTNDIDVVSVGRGIDLARAVHAKWGRPAHLSVFANFGTAQVKKGDMELEFVGARRESYHRDSRKPIVEDGTLEEDQSRRDFTINAMALCLNAGRFGQLLDPFYGLADLQDCVLRTPLDPDVTFSDDPLRMMRGIRFASQLGFYLEEYTFDGIVHNAKRIEIVSMERIATELNKIMLSPRPSVGLELLEKTGLMSILLPELYALKGTEIVEGKGHKDNLTHTYRVVDNVAKQTDNLYLRWAALMHDIAKPVTKRYDRKTGWTFHNHDYIGAKMVKKIFHRLRLPLDQPRKYVEKMVSLHMRPARLADEGVTDSAVRRLLFDAGDDIDDLMLLVEADITSKNPVKVRRYLDNYSVVRRKLIDIEEKDRIRNFSPPVSGTDIIEYFNLKPSPIIGELKEAVKTAILDGVIPNEHDAAWKFVLQEAEKKGLKRNPS